MSESVTTSETFKKENRYGVEKDHVRVGIGTQQVEVPRWLHNPLTDRRHDLTKLSDGGYLKPFLAFVYAREGSDVVDLSTSPFLTFDKDRWELVDAPDGQIVLRKRDAETPLDEMVLEDTDGGPDSDNGDQPKGADHSEKPGEVSEADRGPDS